MDCVNHPGISASAYCQNCGKAQCSQCARTAAGGQILCATCQSAWQNYPAPFPPATHPSGANPAAAAVLGLIPGVGAMYNGQFFKGLIHVVIFAVLISITDHYPIFGLFIAAWVLYQSFEAYHTARARRDGQPLPDPLGLNEVGNWLNLGARPQYPPQPGSGQPNGQTQTPYAAPAAGPATGAPPFDSAQSSYQASYQAPYQAPYPPSYAPGFNDPGFPPMAPVPPVPPVYWRRREPIGAIVLIALGLLFLLGQMDFFSGRMFEFTWPLMLIALGVWLAIRRVGDLQGGRK
jgi:TM2 domain-containing membrane protein YozV